MKVSEFETIVQEVHDIQAATFTVEKLDRFSPVN
jgi:hypothetical protein